MALLLFPLLWRGLGEAGFCIEGQGSPGGKFFRNLGAGLPPGPPPREGGEVGFVCLGLIGSPSFGGG